MGEVVQNFRDSESLRLLYGICSRDAGTRKQVLDNVVKIFDSWLGGYASPQTVHRVVNCDNNCNGISQNGDLINGLVVDFKQLIHEQVPDLLRLSVSCPFSDVRDRCKQILADLEVGFLCLAFSYSFDQKIYFFSAGKNLSWPYLRNCKV